jgi:hypothetical protein
MADKKIPPRSADYEAQVYPLEGRGLDPEAPGPGKDRGTGEGRGSRGGGPKPAGSPGLCSGARPGGEGPFGQPPGGEGLPGRPKDRFLA